MDGATHRVDGMAQISDAPLVAIVHRRFFARLRETDAQKRAQLSKTAHRGVNTEQQRQLAMGHLHPELRGLFGTFEDDAVVGQIPCAVPVDVY